MKYQLRCYQKKASDAAILAFGTKTKRNGILICPTGSGKSLIIADIASRLNAPLVVLQPSAEILMQNFAKLQTYGILDCGCYSASVGSKDINRITFATIGSVMNHMEDFKHFKYVLIDECLPNNVFISTEIGQRRIGQLYKSYSKGENLPKVLSYNELTKTFEPKEIKCVVNNGTKEVYDYKFSGLKIRCTKNHPLLTLSRGWVAADEIHVGEAILTTDNLACSLPVLTDDQKDFILGSMVGDGCVDKSRNLINVNRFSFIHGESQEMYLRWKASMLNCHEKVSFVEYNGISSKPAYRFTSPVCYFEDSHLTKRYAIEHLNAKILAVIYLDDGSIRKDQFGGTIYSIAESEELTILFSNKLKELGIDCVPAKCKSSTSGKTCNYIRLHKKGIDRLSEIIAPYTPKSMSYKLCDKDKYLAGTYVWDRHTKHHCVTFQNKKFNSTQDVFNMEVCDNHNFVVTTSRYDKNNKSFSEGVLVHNCHVVNSKGGMYEKFINAEDRHVVGLTATPYRLSSYMAGSMLKFLTRTRPRIFSEVLYVCQTSDLLAKGYLADLKYYDLTAINLDNVRSNSTGADYDEKSLKMEYERSGFFDKLTTATLRVLKPKSGIPRKGVLVFTRFIEEAENLVGKLKLKGISAAIVTGATPKAEREQLLNDFKSGKIKVVANVGVLVVGFDFPALDTVILARPTKSLAWYYQAVGRSIRPFKGKDGWVIDLAGNYKRFGKVSDLKIDIEKPNSQLWCVKSNGKILTNRMF